jgi:hypothetical protein
LRRRGGRGKIGRNRNKNRGRERKKTRIWSILNQRCDTGARLASVVRKNGRDLRVVHIPFIWTI